MNIKLPAKLLIFLTLIMTISNVLSYERIGLIEFDNLNKKYSAHILDIKEHYTIWIEFVRYFDDKDELNNIINEYKTINYIIDVKELNQNEVYGDVQFCRAPGTILEIKLNRNQLYPYGTIDFCTNERLRQLNDETL